MHMLCHADSLPVNCMNLHPSLESIVIQNIRIINQVKPVYHGPYVSATRALQPFEELRYDYGDRNVQQFRWLRS